MLAVRSTPVRGLDSPTIAENQDGANSSVRPICIAAAMGDSTYRPVQRKEKAWTVSDTHNYHTHVTLVCRGVKIQR